MHSHQCCFPLRKTNGLWGLPLWNPIDRPISPHGFRCRTLQRLSCRQSFQPASSVLSHSHRSLRTSQVRRILARSDLNPTTELHLMHTLLLPSRIHKQPYKYIAYAAWCGGQRGMRWIKKVAAYKAPVLTPFINLMLLLLLLWSHVGMCVVREGERMDGGCALRLDQARLLRT